MNNKHSKLCVSCPTELTGRQQKYCSIECHNEVGNSKYQNYQKQQERALVRKLELISRKGGGCQVCGYNRNLAALCFHQLDPSQKEMKLDARSLSNSTMAALISEADKCQLLCHNCHMELHHPHEKFALALSLKSTALTN